MTPDLKKQLLQEFRNEYRKAYSGILSDEVIGEGNKWFEDWLTQAFQRISAQSEREVVEKITVMIAEQMNIATREGQPTSRLTSLAVKLASLDSLEGVFKRCRQCNLENNKGVCDKKGCSNFKISDQEEKKV